MAESALPVWIAITNTEKFIVEGETREEAAQKFQEKMGYEPKNWQLELMERPDEPLPPVEVELSQ